MSMLRDPPFDAKALARALRPGLTVLTTAYVDPVPTLSALLETSPDTTLEPATGTQTSETTRFTRQFVVYRAREAGTHHVFLHILGTARIHVAATSDTYYYRYYVKLQKTRDFSTFTDLTSETTAFSYSRGPAGSAGWYDDGAVRHFSSSSVTLAEGEFLVLHVRGTSWTINGNASSIGLKSATLPVRVAVVPP